MCTCDQSKNVPGTKYIDSRCVVYFLPTNEWKGEHGFDWFRTNDMGEEHSYKQVVGRYYPLNGPGGKPSFLREGYEDLDYEKKSIIEQRGDLKIEKKKYFVPWISTLSYSIGAQKYSNEITIRLKILAKNIERVEIEDICRDKKERVIKTIEKQEILSNNITFTYTQKGKCATKLLAYCYFKNGETTEKKFAGQANIVENNPINLSIFFVDIVIRKDDRTYISGINTHENVCSNLRKYLCQVQIKPRFEGVITLPFGTLTELYRYFPNNLYDLNELGKEGYIWLNDGIRPGNPRPAVLVEELFNKLKGEDNRYKEEYKIFFSHLSCWTNINKRKDIKGQAVVIQSKTMLMDNGEQIQERWGKSALIFNGEGGPDCVVCHELLHCLGLAHSFDNNNLYVYKQGFTDNIMDYPFREDGKNNKLKQYTLWHWQWEKVREKLSPKPKE